MQKSPYLWELQDCWGKEVAYSWMKVLFQMLEVFCGVSTNLSEVQERLFSDMFFREHNYLTMTEVMIFFYRMMHGEYGEFYGSVSPQKIFVYLEKFLEQRHRQLTLMEQETAKEEHDRREKEEAPYRITLGEWEKWKTENPEKYKRFKEAIVKNPMAVRNKPLGTW